MHFMNGCMVNEKTERLRTQAGLSESPWNRWSYVYLQVGMVFIFIVFEL